MRARRDLDESAQTAAAQAVVEPILDTLRAHQVRTVGAYLGQAGELDLGLALWAVLADGITVVLPVCGAAASLEFCPWRPGDEMTTSSFGIREPVTEPVPPTSIDAFLVPGVGFALDGSRVGHGAGYYDRFFARCFAADHDPFRLGIAHDLQVVVLPEPESWDVAMHQIVTPSRMIVAFERAATPNMQDDVQAATADEKKDGTACE